MFRNRLAGLLLLAFAAEASAQTIPPGPPPIAPAPASAKGQGVYAAPGEPIDVQHGATMGDDGAAPRRAKPTTTLPPPRQAGFANQLNGPAGAQ